MLISQFSVYYYFQALGPENEEEDDSQQLSLENPPKETQETSTSISSINHMQPPVTKKVKKNPLTTQNELLDKACAILSSNSSKTGGSSCSIANDWAETLDTLEPNQRLFAKKAINDILFEAQLGNLDRHSVQINMSSRPISQQLSPGSLYNSTSSTFNSQPTYTYSTSPPTDSTSSSVHLQPTATNDITISDQSEPGDHFSAGALFARFKAGNLDITDL